VVDVGVRDPNLRECDAQLFASAFKQVQITAGVNDRGLHGFITPYDRAVLLKRGNGNGFVMEHAEMLAALPMRNSAGCL
jgi:hypothetical protein